MPPPREILEALQEMPSHVQREAFFLLRGHHLRFTENKNGVFFNLTQAPAEIWPQLHHLLCKEALVQRETEERESCLRQLQESLRGKVGLEEAPPPKATAPGKLAEEAAVSNEPPPPPQGKKTSGRDILSMLRKKAANA